MKIDRVEKEMAEGKRTGFWIKDVCPGIPG